MRNSELGQRVTGSGANPLTPSPEANTLEPCMGYAVYVPPRPEAGSGAASQNRSGLESDRSVYSSRSGGYGDALYYSAPPANASGSRGADSEESAGSATDVFKDGASFEDSSVFSESGSG